MTRREICTVFKELYDADVSVSLISKVTNSVMKQGVEWQARPLDRVIRKAIKKRKLFPHDDAAKKGVYLAIREASKRWARRFTIGAQR